MNSKVLEIYIEKNKSLTFFKFTIKELKFVVKLLLRLHHPQLQQPAWATRLFQKVDPLSLFLVKSLYYTENKDRQTLPKIKHHLFNPNS
jgi:hypothetical protein